VLSDGWGLTAASIGYRAVGSGSHHWEVVGADAVRWFVTADDLSLLQSPCEPDAAAPGRLRAALATALELRDCGAAFVIAPVRTLAGEPLVLTDRRMGVALYPYVDGQSFTWVISRQRRTGAASWTWSSRCTQRRQRRGGMP